MSKETSLLTNSSRQQPEESESVCLLRPSFPGILIWGLIRRAGSFLKKDLKTIYLISEAKFSHSGKGHIYSSCGDISEFEN